MTLIIFQTFLSMHHAEKVMFDCSLKSFINRYAAIKNTKRTKKEKKKKTLFFKDLTAKVQHK